eukprot:363785-Chlamydomonas_euryale.AAC.8
MPRAFTMPRDPPALTPPRDPRNPETDSTAAAQPDGKRTQLWTGRSRPAAKPQKRRRGAAEPPSDCDHVGGAQSSFRGGRRSAAARERAASLVEQTERWWRQLAEAAAFSQRQLHLFSPKGQKSGTSSQPRGRGAVDGARDPAPRLGEAVAATWRSADRRSTSGGTAAALGWRRARWDAAARE